MKHIENHIYYLYKNMNILSHEQLGISAISNALNLDVVYWDEVSTIAYYKAKYRIFINEDINACKQWQHFGHEMSHYYNEEEDSMTLSELYVDYYESKADYFMYHFCVPTFMLQKIKGVDVYDVMNLFNVEFDFALRRLEMYKNNIYGRMMVSERPY